VVISMSRSTLRTTHAVLSNEYRKLSPGDRTVGALSLPESSIDVSYVWNFASTPSLRCDD
jgi:hypothetical protein